MTKQLFIFLFFILSGCVRTYNTTVLACNDRVYLEIFDRYPDCRDYYLTDSINFRTFFLAQDLEHERFHYECKDDTIFLISVDNSSKNCREYVDSAGRKGFVCDDDTILKKTFIVSRLKAEHKFD